MEYLGKINSWTKVAAVSVFSVFAQNAYSAEVKMAAAMGPGAESCARFAEVYRQNSEDAERLYFAWAQGFMSGLNLEPALSNGPTRNMAFSSADDQKIAIRVYCDHHPLAACMQAVSAVYKSLPIVRPIKPIE